MGFLSDLNDKRKRATKKLVGDDYGLNEAAGLGALWFGAPMIGAALSGTGAAAGAGAATGTAAAAGGVTSGKMLAAGLAGSMLPGLVSGYGAYKGAEMTNEANSAIAQKQMDFQEHMWKKQRKFNQRMSNTAMRRGMRDLKKAGLNPMLAYMKGGASSPNVGAPSGAGIPAVNELEPAINSALSSTRLKEELRNMKQQNNVLQEQEKLLAAQTQKATAETALTNTTNTLKVEEIPKAKLQKEVWEQAEKEYDKHKTNVTNAVSGMGNSAKQIAKDPKGSVKYSYDYWRRKWQNWKKK